MAVPRSSPQLSKHIAGKSPTGELAHHLKLGHNIWDSTIVCPRVKKNEDALARVDELA